MATVLSRKPGGSGGGGGGGTPGAPPGSVQFNNAGAFGGIPWWTLDNTPGSEDVDFAGRVTIEPTYDVQPLAITTVNGGVFNVGGFAGVGITPGTGAGADNALIVSSEGGAADIFIVQADEKIGFFGATPAAQPAAPTTINQVVAALQTLGLVDT